MQSYIGTLTYVLVSFIFIVYCEPIANFVKPNPLPKHFAIDIDGTFFVEDKDKMKENIEAFKKLKNKNINPFFCTGRCPTTATILLGDDFFRYTGYNGHPGVYMNGSIVLGSDGNRLQLIKFTDDFMNRFKLFIDEHDNKKKLVFYTEDAHYRIDTLNNEFDKYMTEKEKVAAQSIDFQDLKGKNIVTIFIHGDCFENSNLKDEVYYVKYQQPNVAQISPPGTNKKIALKVLLNSLNSNFDECAFIGDSDNDKEAVESCSTSFAVGNATDQTKQKAKWVMDLNYDQGAFKKAVELLCD